MCGVHADLQGALSAKGNRQDRKPTLNFSMHSPLQINNPAASIHMQRHTHINTRESVLTQKKQRKISMLILEVVDMIVDHVNTLKLLSLLFLRPKHADNIEMSSRWTIVEPCVWIRPAKALSIPPSEHKEILQLSLPLFGRRSPPSVSIWRLFDLRTISKTKDEMKWDGMWLKNNWNNNLDVWLYLLLL